MMTTKDERATEFTEEEEEKKPSRPVRRYIDRTKAKKNNEDQGTFDIQQLISSTTHSIARPEVDLPLPPSSSSSSSSSSLVSFPSETEWTVPPIKPSSLIDEIPPKVVPKKSASVRPAASVGQTNRAVELRRARAQARMQEFSQRSIKSAPKTTNVMSASWHSQMPRPTKRADPRLTAVAPPPTVSSVIVDQQRQQYRKVHQSRREHVDLLRDHGQRLAIDLIQISSTLLEKFKPRKEKVLDEKLQLKQLEELIEQLEGVHQSLTVIDASFPRSKN